MVQKGQVSSVKVDYSNQMNPESPYYGQFYMYGFTF